MTYLNIVNNILRRLREDEVSSVTESTYSTMVGDFVNDAKRIVEDAYQWSALRTDVDVTTTASDNEYSLTGVSTRGKILEAWNETTNVTMREQGKRWLRSREQNAPENSPMYYVYSGLDGSGNINVKFFPTPDKAYVIAFSVVNPQADLSQDSDTLSVPASPVIHLALAMLARERGEAGGTTSGEYQQIAERFLKDAIAIEAARHSDELIYYTV
jgi:hypothetical protein